MHHSTGNVPCAQHTRPLQQDVVLGCTRKERRTDQDLSWYMRLPPFTENSKARDHLLQEQQASTCKPRDVLPSQREGVSWSQTQSGEAPAPLPQTRGFSGAWWRALRSEAAVPESAELRKTRGKVLGEWENVRVSSASSAGCRPHRAMPGATPPPPACAGGAGPRHPLRDAAPVLWDSPPTSASTLG